MCFLSIALQKEIDTTLIFMTHLAIYDIDFILLSLESISKSVILFTLQLILRNIQNSRNIENLCETDEHSLQVLIMNVQRDITHQKE